MADTKVSALTNIASGAVAAGDKFPVADVSDLTVTYHATAANIKTFCTNAPVFAAGSASAGTWPVFTSGTVLTTAEDGAWELDADCFYACTDAGNRGYVPVRHFIRADSDNNLSNSAAEQKIFSSPTNGRITVETGCYLFKGVIHVKSMEALASSNLAFDLVGAGTATCAAWLVHCVGADTNGVGSATATISGTWAVTQQTAVTSVVSGAANPDCWFRISGTFEVTGAGTMIPSVTLASAAAAVVQAGSYLTLERIGSTSVVSIGQWD